VHITWKNIDSTPLAKLDQPLEEWTEVGGASRLKGAWHSQNEVCINVYRSRFESNLARSDGKKREFPFCTIFQCKGENTVSSVVFYFRSILGNLLFFKQLDITITFINF